jgi:cobalt/nickel transport system ATP-binding protein
MSRIAVEARDVSFTYPGGESALRDVSFQVGPGEAVGLLGCNGAGKSTLLLHLNGCLAPSRGEIRIDGIPVTRKTVGLARRAVGLVFQDPDDQLFMPTVFEDVAFGPLNLGLPDADIEPVVLAALGRVGMAHLRDRPPHKLSAGEKRSVAIATVLAMSPGVLVMDEPSANLDPRARRRLIHLLQGFEHTRIIATHDLELVVEVCPRVLVLDGGRIVAEGPTLTLLRNAPLMEAHGLECPHILRHLHPH